MLVDYSDSESDNEVTPTTASRPTSSAPAKPAFQAASGKIKVDLPTIRPDPSAAPEEPPAKKARTAGAFSGINSFLPAPKRTAASNAPKKGVSLKTSSEAAFSREVPQYDEPMPGERPVAEEKNESKPEEEVKLIGKATRFLPLSVSSKKKKKPVLPKAPPPVEKSSAEEGDGLQAQEVAPPPKPKVRKSLFSVQQEEEPAIPAETYEPPTQQIEHREDAIPETSLPTSTIDQQPTLSAVASDLNLTAAQRRHLFGRNGKDVSITHFNMDSEYANNEKMRQAGEVTQHRAVKAVAPGKHSLQQLVNNAKTQRDGLEDAWAEGRKNRGEGSARYGWGK